MVKRTLDICASALGLVLLSPLMLAIMAAVRWDSPGPALFRQVRVTRGGRHFQMLKFRSMRYQPQDSSAQITASGDTRITTVGALLRRTKLDELPQLWNVFRGDMSLVGPRPEVPRYVALYPEHLREVILSVRPGITDEASIFFRDEGALLAGAPDPEKKYINEILPVKLELYVRYVNERSFCGDLRIIARTIWRVAQG
jgi:lipopolysaccharide/colanic/teichoic acid biosynthesis glycosyltransferase